MKSALSRICSASAVKAILRIAPQQFRRDFGRLAEGRRRQHEPRESPDVPTALAEPDGKRIEQFRMARELSLGAELIARFDETDPEKLLPAAIDRDAGRQRILGVRQPVRQIEPGRTRPRLFQRRKNARSVGFHLVARLVVGSTHHHESLPRLRQFREDEGSGNGRIDRIALLGDGGDLVAWFS
jgi:hypothetical protein